MSRTIQAPLPPMPLPNRSRTEAASETPRKSLKDWQELPARALGRAGVSNKAAALSMGKSESWLSRALRGLEKLGWSDIGQLDDPAFWAELLQLMAAFHDVSLGNNEQAQKDCELGRKVREVAGLLR